MNEISSVLGTKGPLFLEDLEAYKTKVTNWIHYLKSLRLGNDPTFNRAMEAGKNSKNRTGKRVVDTNLKTGFVGLIITLTSYVALAEELMRKSNAPPYLLSYRFSQDLLELTHATLRGKGGFCTNPTAQSLKTAYKYVNARSCTKIATGNAIPLSDIPVLSKNYILQNMQTGMLLSHRFKIFICNIY